MTPQDELRTQILELCEKYAFESLKESEFNPGVSPVPVSGKKLSPSDFSSMVDSVLDGWFTNL